MLLLTQKNRRISVGRYNENLGSEEVRDDVISKLIREGFIEKTHLENLKPKEIEALNVENLSQETLP